jgi:hypothetical protein
MAAIANSPSFAKKAGVPQSVGKDFNDADKGKFSKGGDMKSEAMKKGGMAKDDMKQDKGMMQKAVNKHEGRLHKGSPMTKLAKGGGIETKGKTKGKMIAMKSGGKMC